MFEVSRRDNNNNTRNPPLIHFSTRANRWFSTDYCAIMNASTLTFISTSCCLTNAFQKYESELLNLFWRSHIKSSMSCRDNTASVGRRKNHNFISFLGVSFFVCQERNLAKFSSFRQTLRQNFNEKKKLFKRAEILLGFKRFQISILTNRKVLFRKNIKCIMYHG